jgi:HAE1 family hydrophobic/amphiphilic exporter-1
LTTVVVFLPIVYVKGVAAELFREQAWVVTHALMSSLLVAFTLVPALAARLLAQDSKAFKRKDYGFLYMKKLAMALQIAALS